MRVRACVRQRRAGQGKMGMQTHNCRPRLQAQSSYRAFQQNQPGCTAMQCTTKLTTELRTQLAGSGTVHYDAHVCIYKLTHTHIHTIMYFLSKTW